jgi:hypothetical protein
MTEAEIDTVGECYENVQSVKEVQCYSIKGELDAV